MEYPRHNYNNHDNDSANQRHKPTGSHHHAARYYNDDDNSRDDDRLGNTEHLAGRNGRHSSETGLPGTDAGGTVTFTSGGATLCTGTVGSSGAANCGTSSALPAGSYPVIATYQTLTAPTSFTLTPSNGPTTTQPVSLQATATPPTQPYTPSDPVTLTATGLPSSTRRER